MFKKLKTLWKASRLYDKIKKEGDMKTLFKNWTGILKVIGYSASGYALVSGYLPVETALAVSMGISAAIKIAEIITGLTKSKEDDARVAAVKKILEDTKLIK